MREYELGQLLVNDLLPEDMRDYNRVISKGTMGKLMTELAKKHPDKYKEISHKLLQLGYETAYLTNGDSFTLKDMAPTAISKKMQKELNKEVQTILYKAREKGIKSNDPKVTRAILDACIKWSKRSDEGTAAESDFDTNALFRQAQKTGVGAQKPGTYKSIRTGDVLYVDQNNKPVPIPVTRSYAQGLRPAEYFAGAFGTRKGIVDLQKATQDAGYLSKQLVQIAHRLVVDSNDSDQPFDMANPIGYPSNVDDADNEGAMLALPVAGYKRNTILTPKILADMKQKGIKHILVRSVIAGGPANGGIYAYDAGIRENGGLPNIGDFVGINAVQSISEPITQSAISSKHSGGVAGAESGKAISGFKYLNQLIQVPKHFQGGATHATVDGKVERIRPAAQGGYYITVAGIDHYVRTDQGDETPILVKVGDEVEAGDVMSDGIPNPAMIVKYKGLGEGRRYFTNMFRDALDRAGTPVNRRNIEALSRGLINYVKLTSEVGDYSPDDILPYTMVAADYRPRDGYICKEPKACKGMYLEKPVLHYTIGTRITPSIIKELNEYKINAITCHKDPPPFEPEMVRGMAHAANDPDWGTKMLGSYNKESLLESARLGAVSNTQGTSYVPALAFGDPNFGNEGALNQKRGNYNNMDKVAYYLYKQAVADGAPSSDDWSWGMQQATNAGLRFMVNQALNPKSTFNRARDAVRKFDEAGANYVDRVGLSDIDSDFEVWPQFITNPELRPGAATGSDVGQGWYKDSKDVGQPNNTQRPYYYTGQAQDYNAFNSIQRGETFDPHKKPRDIMNPTQWKTDEPRTDGNIVHWRGMRVSWPYVRSAALNYGINLNYGELPPTSVLEKIFNDNMATANADYVTPDWPVVRDTEQWVRSQLFDMSRIYGGNTSAMENPASVFDVAKLNDAQRYRYLMGLNNNYNVTAQEILGFNRQPSVQQLTNANLNRLGPVTQLFNVGTDDNGEQHVELPTIQDAVDHKDEIWMYPRTGRTAITPKEVREGPQY